MKKILLFTYLQRHLKKMIPIIRELSNNSSVSLEVLLMTQEEREIAEQYGITYKMLDEFTTKPRQYDFDLAWGLEPLINAIDKINPDLFLAIEVNFILRNAVRYCREKKIRTIIVQHGTPNKYSLHAFVPFEGDLFLAWGDFSKDFLVQHNMPPEKVILTGGVPFDRTSTLTGGKDLIADALGIDPTKRWLLFTTQPSGPGGIPTPEEIRIGIWGVASSVSHYDDVILIFQAHPSQDIASITEILKETSSNNYIVSQYSDTEALIHSAFAMITFFSTTAIDAVLLRKPLMLINLSDDKDFYPFESMGVALVTHHMNDIDVMVQRLLNSPPIDWSGYERAAQYINYMNDGNALKRVMSIIYQNSGI